MSKERVHVHWFPVYDSVEGMMFNVDYAAIGWAFFSAVVYFTGKQNRSELYNDLCDCQDLKIFNKEDEDENQEQAIMAKMLFNTLTNWADKANEHYDELSKKRSAAARAKWKKLEQQKEKEGE